MEKIDTISNQINQKIEEQAIKSGKKIAESKVQEKLGELDDKTDDHIKGLREKLNAGIIRGGLSLLSSVYFLIALEHLPVLLMLVICYFLSSVVSAILLVVIIIIAIIYLVAYFIIYKFPDTLKGNLGFIFAIILSICEAFFAAYLTQVVSVVWLIIIISILILIMLIITGIAKCLKNEYKVIIGILIGLSLATGLYAIYILVSSDYSWTTLIISYILTNIYQTFIIIIVQRTLLKIEIKEDDDTFKIAIFVTLIVYRKKIEYTVGLIVFLILACVKCCKKKENY